MTLRAAFASHALTFTLLIVALTTGVAAVPAFAAFAAAVLALTAL